MKRPTTPEGMTGPHAVKNTKVSGILRHLYLGQSLIRFGTQTRVTRYSLPKSERPKARRVLRELEHRKPRKRAAQ